MIDPIQIKQEVAKGKLKFWIEGERLYCSDTSPATTTVIIPYTEEVANENSDTSRR